VDGLMKVPPEFTGSGAPVLMFPQSRITTRAAMVKPGLGAIIFIPHGFPRIPNWQNKYK
jgi:hypothetical protein